MKTKTDLGRKIRKYRERLKLKQADLAVKMGFNSSEIISQIERGAREIKVWELVELTRHLQISVSDLIGDRKPKMSAVVLWRKSPETEKELKDILSERGIEFSAFPNQEAMALYNELFMQKRVGACFHLTC